MKKNVVSFSSFSFLKDFPKSLSVLTDNFDQILLDEEDWNWFKELDLNTKIEYFPRLIKRSFQGAPEMVPMVKLIELEFRIKSVSSSDYEKVKSKKGKSYSINPLWHQLFANFDLLKWYSKFPEGYTFQDRPTLLLIGKSEDLKTHVHDSSINLMKLIHKLDSDIVINESNLSEFVDDVESLNSELKKLKQLGFFI